MRTYVGACTCDKFCAQDWDGSIKQQQPSWKGARCQSTLTPNGRSAPCSTAPGQGGACLCERASFFCPKDADSCNDGCPNGLPPEAGPAQDRLGGGWTDGVLSPQGIIYGIPGAAHTVLRVDPETGNLTTFGDESMFPSDVTGGLLLSAIGGWGAGVLSGSGMIYGVPATVVPPYSHYAATIQVLQIDPESDNATVLSYVVDDPRFQSGQQRAESAGLPPLASLS